MGSFECSDALYGRLVGFLGDDESAALTHGELEARLSVDARELVRQLFQDHSTCGPNARNVSSR